MSGVITDTHDVRERWHTVRIAFSAPAGFR
jgi:hypothetical protein